MKESQFARHALLIGIDQYPKFSSSNQLEGCVHDVRALGRVLTDDFRFPKENLQYLCNEEATREGILAAMSQMLDTVDDNDVVVVQFCGHGSQVIDVDGDEADGYDETIVPFDSGRKKSQNRDITDDEINAWLRCLGRRTPLVTLIFDSCHSGTMTRDPFAARVRRLPLDPRPPSQPQWSPTRTTKSRSRNGTESGYTLFAACRDDESAHEMNRALTGGVAHGALSFFLCRELAGLGPSVPSREIFERVAAQITARFRSQHPQLEGAWDREIFGIRNLTAMRHIPVCSRTDNRAALAAGSAHGILSGSRWAVYPPGTREARSEPLGILEVESVGAVTARAKVEAEVIPGTIETGGRAVQISQPSGDSRMAVRVLGSSQNAERVERLEHAIHASPLLTIGTPESAELLIHLGSGDQELELWNVVDRTGSAVLESRRADVADEVVDLIEHLERRSRYQSTLALENSDPRSELRGVIDLELRRFGSNGWELAAPTEGNADVVFYDGDQLALGIRHRYSRPVYVYVLDFGVSGSIDLLYPVRGASEGLIPDHTLEIGVRPGDELDLTLPSGKAGVEIVKLFATLEPTDFGPLLQGSVRQSTTTNEFEGLLRLALCGGPQREIRRREGSDWATVSRPFVLRPKS